MIFHGIKMFLEINVTDCHLNRSSETYGVYSFVDTNYFIRNLNCPNHKKMTLRVTALLHITETTGSHGSHDGKLYVV